MKRKLPPWTPFEEASPMPNEKMSTMPDAARERMMRVREIGRVDGRVYINSRYVVTVSRIEARVEGAPDLIQLSIRRRDRSAVHDWRDMQRIKNEIVGAEAEAVELYPAESRLVDTANQYYLWVVVGMTWPFGFNKRLVSERGIDIGAKQRPWPKGEEPNDLVDLTMEKLEELANANDEEKGVESCER